MYVKFFASSLGLTTLYELWNKGERMVRYIDIIDFTSVRRVNILLKSLPVSYCFTKLWLCVSSWYSVKLTNASHRLGSHVSDGGLGAVYGIVPLDLSPARIILTECNSLNSINVSFAKQLGYVSHWLETYCVYLSNALMAERPGDRENFCTRWVQLPLSAWDWSRPYISHAGQISWLSYQTMSW